MSQSNPTRTIIALGALLPCLLLGADIQAPTVQAPEYVQALQHELTLYPNLRPELAAKLILVESQGRVDAPDGAHGEIGAMQIRPETFAYVAHNILNREDGELNPRVPNDNLTVGIALLNWLLARYDYDEPLALVAYNAGIGTADKAKQLLESGRRASIPASTRVYISTILGPLDQERFADPAPRRVQTVSAEAVEAPKPSVGAELQPSAANQTLSKGFLQEQLALVTRPRWPMMSSSKEWDPSVLSSTGPRIFSPMPRPVQAVFRRPAIPS